MEVKDQLRVRMDQLQVGVGELAKYCGVSNQSVRHWLSGRSYPGKRHIPQIEKRLNIKLDFSPDTPSSVPTTESTLQAQDIALFMKISKLAPEFKVSISHLIDLILAQGSRVTPEELAHIAEMQTSSKHSPSRAIRQAAAR